MRLSLKWGPHGESLGIHALRDIESKLTEDNIVAETFTSFAAQCVLNPVLTLYRTLNPSARHSEIMAIGWKHLGTKLKNEGTTNSVLELIKNMKDGNAAYRANTLKFGLYSVLRQKGPAKSTLALLRCSEERCPANKDPIPYRNLRGDVFCPDMCHLFQSVRPKCSECGHPRADHYTWCQGCQRVFE